MTTTPDLAKSLYQRWGEAFAAEPEMPLDGWRVMIEEWAQVTAEPGGVDYVEVAAGGVPATGSMYTHRKLFGHLAKAVGARGLVVDYRRPPGHIHPAPVEDVVSAYDAGL